MRKAAGPFLLLLAASLVFPPAGRSAGYEDDETQRGVEFPKVWDAKKKPAQEDAALEQLADHQLQMLSDSLKLDDGQRKKVRSILVKKMKRLDELQKEQRSLERRSDEDIRDLLSDDQKESFDALRVMSRRRAPPPQDAAQPPQFSTAAPEFQPAKPTP